MYFKFGENWKKFSSLIDKERLIEAEKSLIKLTNKKSGFANLKIHF